jgi:hypothetical protein
MAYINQYDTTKVCSQVGFKAEEDFKSIGLSLGYGICEAVESHNIKKHIDFYVINSEGRAISVDVKAMKKSSRRDNSFNTESTWLEFRNVNGDSGWLSGEASHIAFERSDCFILVPRKSLFSWAKAKIAEQNGGEINIKAKATSAAQAKYKYYTRAGRRDVLTLVDYKDMLSDIKGISAWQKNKA